MIRILSPDQLRELDAATIRKQGIRSIELMERAALAFTTCLLEVFPFTKQVAVVCGIGNNGGDGLAVARLLEGKGIGSTIFIAGDPAAGTPDFQENLKLLPVNVQWQVIQTAGEINQNHSDLIIDALFGFGLNRPVEGIHRELIDWMNHFGKKVVSVDIPSGMMAGGGHSGAIVHADLTITFQVPKLAFFLPETGPFTGDLRIVDIGLDKESLEKTEVSHFLLEGSDIRSCYLPRKKFSHKGSFGHVLIAGGSKGMTGAPVLSALAALRTGAGLVSAHVPGCGLQALQANAPEVMADGGTDEDRIITLPEPSVYRSAGIGPGMGTDPRTGVALAKFLERTEYPVVLDADALNLLAANASLLHLVPQHSILTPHPGEFRRLSGDWKDEAGKLNLLRQMAMAHSLHIILNGAHSVIAFPDGRLVFNNTGNPFMATAGSGDVLTGMLAALLAQGYAPGDAALMGAFLHGRAGDIAAGGGHPILARDLINAIPDAWESIFAE